MRVIAAVTALLMSSAAAFADDMQDCRPGDPARSIEPCSRIIQSKTETKANQVIALGSRAFAYARKNELDTALKDLNRAIELDAKYLYGLSLRGEVHQRSGRFDRALVDLNAALKIDPAYYLALANRGYTYVRMGDYARATPDLDKAIAVNPSAAFPYGSRGHMYRIKGETDRALPDLNKAIALSPQYVFALMERGDAYQAKGDYDLAAADYARVIAIQPNNAAAQERQRAAIALKQAGGGASSCSGRQARRRDRSRLIAGAEPSRSLRRPTSASCSRRPRRSTARAISRAPWPRSTASSSSKPTTPRLFQYKGEVFLRKGDLEQAAASFDRSIQLNPGSIDVYILRCATLIDLGRLEAAMLDGEHLVRVAGNDARSYNVRGLVRLQQGQLASALEDFDRSITINPAARPRLREPRPRPQVHGQPRTGPCRPLPRPLGQPQERAGADHPRADLHRRRRSRPAPSPSSSRPWPSTRTSSRRSLASSRLSSPSPCRRSTSQPGEPAEAADHPRRGCAE